MRHPAHAPVRRTAAALLLAGAAALGAPAAHAAPAPQPPAAPPAAAGDLVSYLSGLSGRSTVAGQQDGPSSAPWTWQNKVNDITGVRPGLWGGDFAFEQNDIDARPTVVQQAEDEWKAGSLPALMWHSCPPTVGPSCHWDWGDGAIESRLSDEQWDETVTEGTALNTAWKKRLDEAVPYLQKLKDQGVPVLWRPLHEMNDPWAWWGGRPGENGSRKLYRITHDYLVKTKGLDNLVWVWNVKDVQGASGSAADYYPGDDYVDVVTLDAWNSNFPTDDWYASMRDIAGDKPIALAEVGKVPTRAQLAAQPEWTYFSVWIDYLTSNNSDDEIKDIYYDPRVLHQGQVSPLR